MTNAIEFLNHVAVGWWKWVFHATWQGTLVAGFVLLAVRLGRRWPSPLRYALLLLVLVKFALPPTLSLPVGLFSRVSLAPAPSAPVAQVTSPARTRSVNARELPAIERAQVTARTSATVGEPGRSISMRSAPVLSWRGWLLLAHAAGALWIGASLARGLWALRRRFRSAASVCSGELFDRYVHVARRMRMGRLPALGIAPTGAPVAFGIVRPRILVSPTVERMPARAQETVLAHELAHHKRGDLIVNWTQAALAVVWWFNPVLWLVNRSVRRAREDCCDDLLLAQQLTRGDVYCDALLRTACAVGIAASVPVAAGMGEHPLGDRFRRIMDTTLSRSSRLSAPGLFAVLLVGGLVLPGLTRQSGERDAQAEDKGTGVETVHGRVLDADGQPVEGAELRLVPTRRGLRERSGAPVRATTDAAGAFQFEIDLADLPWDSAQSSVVATRAGHGFAWTAAFSGALELRLTADDVPLRIRVLDLEGRPVEGAELRILSVQAAANGDLSPWLKALDTGTVPVWTPLAGFFDDRVAWSFGAEYRSDAKGRIEVAGIGRERLVTALIEGERIVTTKLSILTRSVETFRYPKDAATHGLAHTYYGAEFALHAGPARPIVGVVRDAATKQPVAGAVVRVAGSNSGTGAPNPALQNEGLLHVSAVTDEQGRYELVGLPQDVGMHLHVSAESDVHAYLPNLAAVPDSDTLDAVTLDFELGQAYPIRGTIVDQEGRPVEGARVLYQALAGNEFAARSGGQDPRMSAMARSAEDGRFAIKAVPGPGFLAVEAGDDYITLGDAGAEIDGRLPGTVYFAAYSAVELIEPAEGEDGLDVSLRVSSGPHHECTVLDPDGQPLAGARAFGATHDLFSWSAEPTPSEILELRAFNPKRPRPVVVAHTGRGLGAVWRPDTLGSAAGEERAFAVRLEPFATVAGRLVDEYGDARAHVELELIATLTDTDMGPRHVPLHHDAVFFTDADGHFVLDELIAGLTYSIVEMGDPMTLGDEGQVARMLQVDAGERRDLGDVESKPVE